MKYLLLLATALLVQACDSSDALRPDEQLAISIVDSLNAEWAEAFNNRDVGALTQLFVANGVRQPNVLPTAEGSDQLRQQYEGELASLGDIELNASVRTEEVIVSNGLIIARGVSFSEINRRDAEEPVVAAGKWMAVVERDGDGKWKYRWSTFNSTRDASE